MAKKHATAKSESPPAPVRGQGGQSSHPEGRQSSHKSGRRPKRQGDREPPAPFSPFRQKKLPLPEEFLAKLPASQRRIADALRNLILKTVPRIREAVKPGWKVIGYHAPHYFCFLFPRGDQVHLGFEWGARLSDPQKRLQGEGDYSQVRYLSFTDVKQIVPKELAPMIRESASPVIKGSSKIRPEGQRPGMKYQGKPRK
jgi:hypothetical protein